MQAEQFFQTAMRMEVPWYVGKARYDLSARNLTIRNDFGAGSCFRYREICDYRIVHETQIEGDRYSNFIRDWKFC